jgi:hypothetical protein
MKKEIRHIYIYVFLIFSIQLMEYHFNIMLKHILDF